MKSTTLDITEYENCSIINIATGILDTICFSILHINYIVFMIYGHDNVLTVSKVNAKIKIIQFVNESNFSL